jgi:hypothetical protein
MKSAYLTPLACAALLLGGAIANAQDSNEQSSASNAADQQSGSQMSTPGKEAAGNDLDTTSKAPQVNPTNSPPTAGQNKGSGNDMVDQNGTANPSGSSTQGNVKQASAARPDFSTLDKKGNGTLTADDVKSNKWLRKNFAKCDTDHDGTLDRSEYSACK